MSSPSAPVVFWEYSVKGAWFPYTSHLSDMIELYFQSKSKQPLELAVLGEEVVLDFSFCSQVTLSTGAETDIRRTSKPVPTWCYMDYHWIELSPLEAKNMEVLFQGSTDSGVAVLTTMVGGIKYTFDFKTMTQRNDYSFRHRNIQRFPSHNPFNPMAVVSLPAATALPAQPQPSPMALGQHSASVANAAAVAPVTIASLLATYNTSALPISAPALDSDDESTIIASPAVVPVAPGSRVARSVLAARNPLQTMIWNELIRLPTKDLSFPPITITSISLDKFATPKKFLSRIPCVLESEYLSMTIDKDNIGCPICMCDLWERDEEPFPDTALTQLQCGHLYHIACLKAQITASGGTSKGQCGLCRSPFFDAPGPQPNGTLVISYDSRQCTGFHRYGTIVMTIAMPSGAQDDRHPSPGTSYSSDSRDHVMPATPFVLSVLLKLYVKAFLLRQLLTIGFSPTRGTNNVITYSSIHFKSSYTGGAENHGYPDDNFEQELSSDIKAAGITLTAEELAL